MCDSEEQYRNSDDALLAHTLHGSGNQISNLFLTIGRDGAYLHAAQARRSHAKQQHHMSLRPYMYCYCNSVHHQDTAQVCV